MMDRPNFSILLMDEQYGTAEAAREKLNSSTSFQFSITTCENFGSLSTLLLSAAWDLLLIKYEEDKDAIGIVKETFRLIEFPPPALFYDNEYDSALDLLLTESGFAGLLGTNSADADQFAGMLLKTIKSSCALKEQRKKYLSQEFLFRISQRVFFGAETHLAEFLPRTLEEIGGHICADRVFFGVLDQQKNSMLSLTEWHADGLEPMRGSFRSSPERSFPWFFLKVSNSEIIYLPALDHLPQEAFSERELWEEAGVCSSLVVPTSGNDSQVGFIGCTVEGIAERTDWKQNDFELLSSLALIFKAASQREQEKSIAQRHEELFQAAFYRGMDSFILLDAVIENGSVKDFIIAESNNRLYSLVEDEYEEVKGLSIIELFPDVMESGLFERAVKAYLNQEIVMAENAFVWAGTERWYRQQIIPVKTGLAVHSQDVTAGKWGELLLKESERKFRLMFEKSQDPILLIDDSGRFIDVNESACRVFGLSQAEFFETDLFEISLQERSSSARENWHELLEKGDDEGLFYYHKNDDSVVTLEYRAKASLFPGTHFFWMRDVTETIRARNELLQINADLEQSKKMLEQRTSDLESTYNELLSAKDRLQELNRSKDKLFSIVAHDLRSPFHGLIGLTDILRGEFYRLSPEKVKIYVERINSMLKKVFHLVENLLEWSRLQTNKMEFNPARRNLKDAVQHAYLLLQEIISKKNISFLNQVSDTINLLADQKMLNSVLMNLLSNAVKFTPKGGVIGIKARVLKDMVEVTVFDTGIGIPEKDLCRLFRIDEQFTQKGTENEEGSGLGLLLSKDMIEKHNGKIRVESEEGKGTRFHFTIPNFL